MVQKLDKYFHLMCYLLLAVLSHDDRGSPTLPATSDRMSPAAIYCSLGPAMTSH